MSVLKLAIIGHVAYNEDKTRHGVKTSEGGSGYYAAVGAVAAGGSKIGLVANVGTDFPLKRLTDMQVDTEGVSISSTLPTAKFVIDQITDNERIFTASWGAVKEMTCELPASYKNAEIIHLATAPPEEQIRWIEYLRIHSPRSMVTVDCFEHFARHNKQATLEAMALADFVFLNMEEFRILGIPMSYLSEKGYVLKAGSSGATLFLKGNFYPVPAPKVEAIDTTGAGDVLAGAFLSQYSTGNFIDALSNSTEIASLSVTQFGVNHLLKQKEYEEQALAL